MQYSIRQNARSLKYGIHQPELTAVRTAGFAHFVRTSPVPAGRALASEKAEAIASFLYKIERPLTGISSLRSDIPCRLRRAGQIKKETDAKVNFDMNPES